MNDIDSMPSKCHDCSYWETCEEPYICPTHDEKKELLESKKILIRRLQMQYDENPCLYCKVLLAEKEKLICPYCEKRKEYESAYDD